MTISSVFFIFAMVLMAPHMSHSEAKIWAWLCLAAAFAFPAFTELLK